MASAPTGAKVPGVLSTGLKTESFSEYRGDTFSATELSIAVAVAPAGADITVKIRQNGSFIQHSGADAVVTISDGDRQGALVLSSAITVNDKDLFDPHITGVGSSPNEGSDLVWSVVP